MILHSADQPSFSFSTIPLLSNISLPYAGVFFTLICTVELSVAGDTAVSVSQRWTRGGSALPVDSRIMVSPLNMTSDRMYNSHITFNPLSNLDPNGDSGNYACSATVTAELVGSTISSIAGHFIEYLTITVQGTSLFFLENTLDIMCANNEVYTCCL